MIAMRSDTARRSMRSSSPRGGGVLRRGRARVSGSRSSATTSRRSGRRPEWPSSPCSPSGTADLARDRGRRLRGQRADRSDVGAAMLDRGGEHARRRSSRRSHCCSASVSASRPRTRAGRARARVHRRARRAMAISATVGTTTLLLTDGIDADHFLERGRCGGRATRWACSSSRRSLCVAAGRPRLRSGASRMRRLRWSAVEAAALFAALITACLVAVRSQKPLLFLVLPLLGWIAWRFQQRGAAPAALIVSVIVIAAAADDMGPFAGESLLSQMILLQSFNASVAFTSLLFAVRGLRTSGIVEREQGRPARALPARAPRRGDACSAACCPTDPGGDRPRGGGAVHAGDDRRVAIGGDWYDIIPFSEGRLGLVIGDVAGHGVNAAATMGQIRMALRAYARRRPVAGRSALGRLNRLMRELQPGAMATVLYGHLDPATRDLCFANAGHPPPLLIIGPHNARYHRRRALAAGGRLVARRLHAPSSVWIESGRDARALHRRVWSSGGASRSTSGSGCCNARPGKSPDDLEAACDHLMSDAARRGPGRRRRAPGGAAAVARRRDAPAERSRAARDRFVDAPVARALVARERCGSGPRVRRDGRGHRGVHERRAARLRHGRRDRRPRSVIEHGTVKVTICDGGTWRPPADGHDGCGLMMMRALMDSVKFETSSKGTRVTMTRDAQRPAEDG